MVGRYAKFQYCLVGENSWQDFNSTVLKDSDGKTMFASGSYQIPFSGSNGASLPRNIKKVRFVSLKDWISAITLKF